MHSLHFAVALTTAVVGPETGVRAQTRIGAQNIAVGRVFQARPIVLDAYPAATKSSSVTLKGTAARAWRVEIVGPSRTIRVPVAAGRFSVKLPLLANQTNVFWLTSISEERTRSAPVVAKVIQDAESPRVFIDTPSSGLDVTTTKVDVAGRVGDRLTGHARLSVKVNGIAAVVEVGLGTTGTFLARDVPRPVSIVSL